MTSLPTPLSWPDARLPAVSGGAGGSTDSSQNNSAASSAVISEEEQFLLRAFRSFAAAAGSLEHSYGLLRAEVQRLNGELEQTQAKLHRERALAEVSAVLAHEIRNPLASLELFAGLLAESRLNEEACKWVEHMQAGLRGLAATVNNVLHFHSLPEAERVPVDLGQLITWSRDFFAPLARQSGVTFSLQNRLEGVELRADRNRLEQVLMNLVLNAVRAMPGGGWIEIGGHRIRQQQSGFPGIVLFVADTGPGIAPENLFRVFDPGFSTHPGSPGLGLAVCRKIVEQHGGTITAASPPNRGATFTLEFPGAEMQSAKPAEKAQGASA